MCRISLCVKRGALVSCFKEPHMRACVRLTGRCDIKGSTARLVNGAIRTETCPQNATHISDRIRLWHVSLQKRSSRFF